MMLGADFLLSLALAVAAGFGSYAAIRADLARLHERATNAHELASRANNRIDQLQGHQ